MHPNPVLPPHGPLSLEDAIRGTAAAFDASDLHYGHGTDNALDEATWLLLHALERPVDQAPDYAENVPEAKRSFCNDLIRRRIEERVPVAYLTGTAWFAGHEFLSDQRALVPRSPLAELINDDFFGLFNEPGSVIQTPPSRILDLCTGGGCIGMACALALPDATVVCADLSKDALSLAAENLEKHQLADRVTLVHSDLFNAIDGRFDLIISNPPYVDAPDMASIPDEFRAEPEMGLAAGDDGLDLVRVMMDEAGAHLTERGWMIVEVGNSEEAMKSAFANLPLEWIEFSRGGQGVFAVPATALKS